MSNINKRIFKKSKEESNQIRFQREVIREEYLPAAAAKQEPLSNELRRPNPKTSKK